MKPKENQVRTYDADGFRKRAACLCLNTNRDKVLLVSSSRYPDRWVVPGGGLEPEEQPSQAAIREVAEESSHSRPAEEHCRGGEDSGMDSRNGHRSSTSLEGRMQQNKKHECSSNIDSTGQSIESHVVGAVSKHRLESSNSQTSNRLSTLAKNCDTR
uniref:Nudix hydrolase domain-containing protein n=1 Tax=Branchiostoma floridae TaxID=7739 RepID=C3Y1F5_BRAFL|eukprot:XP_002609685.1 hypothetical protein BRAFLDRAFT_83698 [Branchiostoma floridae]